MHQVTLPRRAEAQHRRESAPQPKASVRLRPIAVPSEHGGWGMLGAPILTGLLVAPSWAGACIALAGAGAFLTRQPLRLALGDLKKGKRYPRTKWALLFASTYASLALLGLWLAVWLAAAPFWAPLAVAAVLGITQFSFDLQGKGRSFIPEVCGAATMALLATAIVNAAGLTDPKSWLLAAVLALQSATAISYAAARVRLARDVDVPKLPVRVGHLIALAIVSGFVAVGWLGWPIALGFAVLAARSVRGISCHRANVKASMVGLQEVGYALLTVACLVISAI